MSKSNSEKNREIKTKKDTMKGKNRNFKSYVLEKFLQEELGSPEDCHDLCHSREDCRWFSYDFLVSGCFLFKDCPTLDESCTSCVSSSANCKGKTSKF
jgi:hypothetical protein